MCLPHTAHRLALLAIARLHATRPAVACALLHRLRQELMANRSAAAPGPDPADPVVARKAAVLAEAFGGALAPMRQAILDATDPDDALRRASAAFIGMRANRVAQLVDEGLQLAAAAGAADAAPRRKG